MAPKYHYYQLSKFLLASSSRCYNESKIQAHLAVGTHIKILIIQLCRGSFAQLTSLC